ncbi:MAG: prolyl oligopeptidase family serine peptidase [Varibaculum sp.]
MLRKECRLGDYRISQSGEKVTIEKLDQRLKLLNVARGEMLVSPDTARVVVLEKVGNGSYTNVYCVNSGGLDRLWSVSDPNMWCEVVDFSNTLLILKERSYRACRVVVSDLCSGRVIYQSGVTHPLNITGILAEAERSFLLLKASSCFVELIKYSAGADQALLRFKLTARTDIAGFKRLFLYGDRLFVSAYRWTGNVILRFDLSRARVDLLCPALGDSAKIIIKRGRLEVVFENLINRSCGRGSYRLRPITQATMINGVPVVLYRHRRSFARKLILTSYGCYGKVTELAFDPMLSLLYRLGCDVAVAYPRGGGELGDKWHLAGSGRNKKITIRDINAVVRGLRNDSGSKCKIVALSESAGASVVLLSELLNQGGCLFDGLLLSHPVISIASVVRARGRYSSFEKDEWEEFLRLNSLSCFEALRGSRSRRLPPLLVFATRHDPLAPFHDVDTFISTYRNRGGHALLNVESSTLHGGFKTVRFQIMMVLKICSWLRSI